MTKIELIKAKDIQAMEIEPLTWIVKDLIPEGLSLLAGRPKVGKSWFALNIAVAVAEGNIALNKFQTSKSKVLYIPYEDNTRRIKSRLNCMLNGNEAHENLFFPKDLYFPKINQEGLDCISQSIENEDGIKLIIIDTFGSAVIKGNTDYSFKDDYDFMMRLQKLALKYHIAILLLHHLRKGVSTESVYDDIIGTTGMTASPDTLMIIKKYKEGHILHIMGRDVQEADYKSVFDVGTFFWNVTDDKVSFVSTVERQAIIDSFESNYDIELQVNEIADKTDKSREATSQLLRKMCIANEIIKGSKTGYYHLPRLN
jgi:RecA-family ATPase